MSRKEDNKLRSSSISRSRAGRSEGGCISGIFQLFDRRHSINTLPPPPSSSSPLVAGQNANRGNDLGDKTPKKVTKEKQCIPTESSRTSISSSCSSSIESNKKPHSQPLSSCHHIFPETPSPNFPITQTHSSVLCNDPIYREARVVSVKKDNGKGRAMKHIDSPRPLLQLKSVQPGVTGGDAPPRLSCDGRVSQYSLKSTVTIKDLPRLSLDSRSGAAESRSNYLSMEHEPGSNKRPSGVVARLMGLEAFPDSTPQHQEDLKTISRLGDEIKQNPRFHTNISHPVSSVYGETERRLKDLEFKISGKDVKDTKQTFEGLEKTRKRSDGNKVKRPSNVKTRESKYSRKVPVTKFETEQGQHGNALLSPTIKGNSSPRRDLMDKKTIARTQRAPVSSKVAERVAEKPASVRRITGTASLTRLQQKKNGVEKQRRPISPPSDSRKVRKQPSKQIAESRSPARKLKTKSTDLRRGDAKPSELTSESISLSQYSDSVSMQSESSINFDPKDKNFNASLSEDKSIGEQPSPVSVLDATFYGEGSPSPVKKLSNTFEHDDEAAHYIEGEWDNVEIDDLLNSTRPSLISKLNNQFVHKIILSNPIDDKANKDLITLLCNTNPDRRYITDILLTLGFLQDSSTNQLHPAGYFIDQNFFHVLEKTEGETEHANDGQKRNTAKSKSNQKIERKLLSDAVNEILGHKLASASSSIFPKKLGRRRSSEDKLLEEVWSEIVKLQSWGDSSVDDEDDDGLTRILSADMMNQSNEWTEYDGEFSGLVLDVERLIFKDLIREVVNGGAADLKDRKRRRCRQLFSK